MRSAVARGEIIVGSLYPVQGSVLETVLGRLPRLPTRGRVLVAFKMVQARSLRRLRSILGS